MPIATGFRIKRFQAVVDRVSKLRPELKGQVTSYGWHGTRGYHAKKIAKDGFDMSKITSKEFN